MHPFSFRATPFIALVALFAAACSPPWTILRQASPNPFVDHHTFVLAPFSFEGATIEGESEQLFLMRARPRMAEAFVRGHDMMAQGFYYELSRNPRHSVAPLTTPVAPPGVYVIRPRMLSLQMERTYGSGMRMNTMPANGYFDVQIFAPDGTLLDDFQVHASELGSMGGGLDFSMNTVGRGLGYWVGRYLDQRSAPPPPPPATHAQPAH